MSFTSSYFYPRPPGGGRRFILSAPFLRQAVFLSTPSGWRATLIRCQSPARSPAFLSTPSGWRATPHRLQRRTCMVFLSTPSGWRATPKRSWIRYGSHYFYPRPPGGGRQQKRTKFSSVFAKKGEEFASLRRGKRKICRWRFKKDKFWVLIWCEGSRKSVCALASHCG